MLQPILLRSARFIGHLKWLRRGVRERAIQLLLRLSSAPKALPFTANLRGLEYSGTLDNLIDRNVYFYGIYEPEIVALFELTAKVSNRCALDVGANVGHHSLLLSRLFSVVEAFEPWAKVRERLALHLECNGISNVHVHVVALGDTTGMAPFHVPPEGNLGQGSLVAGHAPPSALPDEQVPVRKGDDHLREATIAEPDLIKVDVEGYEGQVLRGLRATLERSRPVVILELSSSTREQVPTEGVLRSLFPPNYSFHSLQSRQVVLWIFEKETLAALPLDFSAYEGNVLAMPAECTKAYEILWQRG